MLHIVSTMVLILIGLGLRYRRRPEYHIKFMTTAFVTDVLLVLYLELTRGAVETVATSGNGAIWVHAGLSLCVLGLYVAMIVLGRRLLAARQATVGFAGGGSVTLGNPAQNRRLHRNLGMVFCVFRGLNYVTALML